VTLSDSNSRTQLTNNMSCSLQPLASQLQSSCTALLSELQAAVTNADDTTFTTVMGKSCCAAGRKQPKDIQSTIKASAEISAAFGSDGPKNTAARKAIRHLIDHFSDLAATGCFNQAVIEFHGTLVQPVQSGLLAMTKQLAEVQKDAGSLMASALRTTGAGKISAERAAAIKEYTASTKLLQDTIAEIDQFALQSAQMSAQINTLMSAGGAIDHVQLQHLQGVRKSFDTEKTHTEAVLLKHFDSGLGDLGGSRKPDALSIPKDLNKDKCEELIQAIRHFVKQRIKEFYCLVPELFRVLDDFDPALGVRYRPPTKSDGYIAVAKEFRDRYDTCSAVLWDELWLKLPAEAKAKLKATNNYGVEDQETVKCEPKDGVTAVFGLLTLYKSVGAAYREELTTKLEASVNKFSNGSNPSVVVEELRELLSKITELGVKLEWSKVGKPVVTLLIERSNNFATRLGKYAEKGGIVSPMDCGVELEQVYTDIQQACKDMQGAGLSLKGLAGRVHAARSDTREMPDCRFGRDCYRKDCKFAHKDGKKEQGEKQKQRGEKRGRDKDSAKKFDNKTGDKMCKAEGCKSSSKGWRFCQTCHRKGIEDGGKIKMQDGTTKTLKYSADSRRIAQLEAKLKTHEKNLEKNLTVEQQWANGSDDEGESVDMFGLADDDVAGPESAKRSNLAVIRLPAGDHKGKRLKLVRRLK